MTVNKSSLGSVLREATVANKSLQDEDWESCLGFSSNLTALVLRCYFGIGGVRGYTAPDVAHRSRRRSRKKIVGLHLKTKSSKNHFL